LPVGLWTFLFCDGLSKKSFQRKYWWPSVLENWIFLSILSYRCIYVFMFVSLCLSICFCVSVFVFDMAWVLGQEKTVCVYLCHCVVSVFMFVSMCVSENVCVHSLWNSYFLHIGPPGLIM
jgi:hypothetical protein